MIDTKLSFRKGAVIVEINVERIPCQHCGEMDKHTEACIMRLICEDVLDTAVTRLVTDHTTINKAKMANRITRYRVIPHGLRRKVNGVWVR